MKKIIRLSTLCLAIAILSPSCKKYEEGPGLSLRSKKARFAGEWTLSSLTSEYTSTSGSGTYSSKLASTDGSTLTQTEVNGSETETWTGTITESLTIEKDGSLSRKTTTILTRVETESFGGGTIQTTTKRTQTTEDKGTWNWLGGVGEAKKKQYVSMTITGNTSSSVTETTTVLTSGGSTTTSTSTSSSNSTDTYEGTPWAMQLEIVLLKNKELKMRYTETGNGSSTYSGGTSTNSSVDKYEVSYKQ